MSKTVSPRQESLREIARLMREHLIQYADETTLTESMMKTFLIIIAEVL